MSLIKIGIYIERNTKIEYRKYTIYKATLYLKTILLKNVFLKRSVWMAGIAGDLFLKLYLVILVSGKLALRGWFGILETFLNGETTARHTFLCSDSQCFSPGDPRILCVKHGYPITGKWFISNPAVSKDEILIQHLHIWSIQTAKTVTN